MSFFTAILSLINCKLSKRSYLDTNCPNNVLNCFLIVFNFERMEQSIFLIQNSLLLQLATINSLLGQRISKYWKRPYFSSFTPCYFHFLSHSNFKLWTVRLTSNFKFKNLGWLKYFKYLKNIWVFCCFVKAFTTLNKVWTRVKGYILGLLLLLPPSNVGRASSSLVCAVAIDQERQANIALNSRRKP